MTAVLQSASAATILLLLTAVGAAQVAPPRDARPPSQEAVTGTAMISGAVRMAGSTQPARKVRVSLSASELRGGRTAITDDQGRFSFTALPAGRYNLSANKPGHLSVTYGQRQPGRAGTAIQLGEGQKFQADLEIPRGSVITGVVLDENGEPAPQTSVRAMRLVVQNGRRTVQNSSSGSTDDRGIYRIFSLLPGEYVVCATPRNNTLGDFDRMQVEMQALRQNLETVARVDEERARALNERIAMLQASIPESPDEAPPGYAPICYPGSIAASTATAVPVGISEERQGIDFQLQLAPLARIEGTVVNSTGAQLREVNVTLTDAQPTGFSMGNINARADAEGRFRLMNVPPGQYRVVARATVAPRETGPAAAPPGGGRGRGAMPMRQEQMTVWASADVVVDGRNLSNVMLALQQGVTVSGQIVFEGSTAPPADLTRMRVSVSSVDQTPFGGTSNGRVDASGRFSIPGVVPGRYRLTASGAPDWRVDTSVISGQDAMDFPFEVKGTQAVSGAVITFTDRQTEITGIVTDDKNQPAPGFTLVVFAADSRYWASPTRRVQSTRPATDGRYTFRNLPPGEYRLAPVVDLEPGALSDPAFLQTLEATALRVTLQPGEKKTQDMRVGGN